MVMTVALVMTNSPRAGSVTFGRSKRASMAPCAKAFGMKPAVPMAAKPLKKLRLHSSHMASPYSLPGFSGFLIWPECSRFSKLRARSREPGLESGANSGIRAYARASAVSH
jgi:hypothetical protein